MEKIETEVSYVVKVVLRHGEDVDPHELAGKFNVLVMRDAVKLRGMDVECDLKEIITVVDDGIPF